MQINYPANYEVGDIVFTAIGSALFREIASASNCWSNHVGMIIGHDGRDYIVAESRIPLSSTTTLNRFIRRSAGQRHCVRRLSGGLTVEQKQALLQQVPSRLHKVYHTGFNYDSSRQFCSKFVFDIYQEALSMQIGSIENFDELLRKNPQAKLTFWKFWFIGAIPWSRNTVTPASLWRNRDLSVVYRSHSDMQP